MRLLPKRPVASLIPFRASLTGVRCFRSEVVGVFVSANERYAWRQTIPHADEAAVPLLPEWNGAQPMQRAKMRYMLDYVKEN
jgi:hypothetical protein